MDSPVRRYISSSSKPKGRGILLVGGLILAVGLYLSRERIERAMIAYRVYRARIFTPPPSVPWRDTVAPTLGRCAILLGFLGLQSE